MFEVKVIISKEKFEVKNNKKLPEGSVFSKN